MKLKLPSLLVALMLSTIATACVEKNEAINQSNIESPVIHKTLKKPTASKTIENISETLIFNLPIETLIVRFDDPIEVLNTTLSRVKAERRTYPSMVPGREDLIYPDLGLTIIFKEQKLSGLFLYIDQEGQTNFVKSCSYLDVNFWKNPNIDSFETLLLGAGFKRETSKVKFHTFMVKNDIRYVYIKRPDTEHIFISRSR